MSAFCTSCGAPMEAEDRHCPRCGRPQSGTVIVRSLPAAEPVPRRLDLRLVAATVVGAVFLVFLVGLLLGRLTAPGRQAGGSHLAAAPGGASPTAAAPAHAATSPPRSSQTPTPSPTPTAASPAQFSLVRTDIANNGRCTTANGCGITATFRNQGSGRGSGTARLSVGNADGSTTYAGCTVAIPVTDPAGTVEVSCVAQSPELAAFLQTGNFVYPHGNAG